MSMLSFKKLFLLTSIFFTSNKNLFVERFGFLKNISTPKQQAFVYYFYFLLTNYILKYLIIGSFVYYHLDLRVIFVYVIFSYLLKIVLSDVDSWRFFYRSDVVVGEPSLLKRFYLVLFNNLFLELFVKVNIILDCFLLIILKISFLQVVCFFSTVMILYIIVNINHFIVLNLSIIFKKVYSIISYFCSLIISGFIFFKVIDILINTIKNITSRKDYLEVFDHFVMDLYGISKSAFNYLSHIYCFFIVLFILSIYFLYVYKKVSSEEENIRSQNHFVLCVVLKFVNQLKNPFYKLHIKKDISAINYYYKYLVKDYFYVFIVDRPISMLIAVFLLLYKYPISYSYLIFLPLSSLLVFLEVSSTISNKLRFIFSFVSDFNAIKIYKSTDKKINDLFKSKIIAFYILKIPSLFIYLISFSVFSFILDSNWIFIILIQFNVILCYLLSPYIIIVNNYIYSRTDYHSVEKFLEDNSLVENNSKEFIVLSSLYKLFFALITMLALGIYKFQNLFSSNLIPLIICAILNLIGIFICFLIMKKIKINIFSFIESGNFTSDYSKIFNFGNNKFKD